MADNGSCRECKFAQKTAKDRKPMRPGTMWCDKHRKAVQNNYTCGQFTKK